MTDQSPLPDPGAPLPAVPDVPVGPGVPVLVGALEATDMPEIPEAPVDDEPTRNTQPKDYEEAQRALADVQELLGQYAAVREQVRSEPPSGDDDQAEKIAPLTEAHYLSQLRARVERLHPADVAYVLEALPRQERLLVWDSVKAEADGAILLEVSEPVRDSLVDSMTRAELVMAVKELDADDLADLADHLPPEVVDEVRRQLTPEEREQLRAAMSYPDQSVGARMDFDLVTVREDVKLEVVLRYLRRFDALPLHTDQVFVVDRYDTLKGALPIDQLLINEPEALVSDVMRRDVLALRGLDEDDPVADFFHHIHHVAAVKNRFAVFGQLADQVLDNDHTIGVEAAQGLVEDDDVRIVNQAAGQQHLLFHTLAERIHTLMDVRKQSESRHHFADPAFTHVRFQSVQVAHKMQELGRRQNVVQLSQFGDIPDAAFGLHRVIFYVDTLHPDFSAVIADQAA